MVVPPQNIFDVMGGWMGWAKGAMVDGILFCSDQDGWLSRSYVHADVPGGKMAQEGVSGSR